MYDEELVKEVKAIIEDPNRKRELIKIKNNSRLPEEMRRKAALELGLIDILPRMIPALRRD